MTRKKNHRDSFNQKVSTDELTNEQFNEEQISSENDNVTESKENNWQEKYDDLNDTYLRLNAEFDNFRKRTLKEKTELIKMGGERILTDFLPIIDDFDRAIENLEKSENVAALKEGVDLIYGKLIAFLQRQGVKEIPTVGEPFDVDKHEALTMIPATDDSMKDKIVDCVQKGYILEDKVIRYPKVVVAK